MAPHCLWVSVGIESLISDLIFQERVAKRENLFALVVVMKMYMFKDLPHNKQHFKQGANLRLIEDHCAEAAERRQRRKTGLLVIPRRFACLVKLAASMEKEGGRNSLLLLPEEMMLAIRPI